MRSIKNFNRSGGKPDSDPARLSQDLSNKYSGYSRSELMGELMRAVAASRADGSFSSEQLDEFFEFVAPSLDDASRERLAELIKQIEEQ